MDCIINLFIKAWIKLVASVAGWIEETEEREISFKNPNVCTL